MEVEIILPAAAGLAAGRSIRRLQPVRLVFHAAAFAWFVRVFLWHFTPEASLLPGAVGFGWFFRYLTYCSFTLQTFTLAVCVLDDLLIPTAPKGKEPPRSKLALSINRAADNLSCSLFAFANVVTIMYHVLEAITHNMNEGDAPRPPWLNSSVHVLNCICAWVDILLADHQHPRSFSHTSRNMVAGMAVTYMGWIMLCREMVGKFPYPFLNNLPFPNGFIGVATVSVAVLVAIFQLGHTMHHTIQRVRRRFMSAASVKHKVF